MWRYEDSSCLFFFFNDTATTEIYTLSLHDALPISPEPVHLRRSRRNRRRNSAGSHRTHRHRAKSPRSEEHTSELQSRQYLVCRLLLEKKNNESSHGYWSLSASCASASASCRSVATV